MRKRSSSITRRSLVGAVVGLAFAAAAGVGLAQITTGSAQSTAGTSTTVPRTTTLQTTGDFESRSADDQESESESDFESEPDDHGTSTSSTSSSTTSTTTPHTTTTTRDDSEGDSRDRQEKMDVCHKTGSGNEHTINIAAPAVSAHVSHGDTIGACVHVAATTTARTAITTTTSSRGHGQKAQKSAGPRKVHRTKQSGGRASSHGNSGRSAGGSDHGKAGGGKSHGK